MNAKKATTKKTKKVYARSAKFPKSGERLRTAREGAKVSLRALAEGVGLSYETVRLVEQGRGGFSAFRTIVKRGAAILSLSKKVQHEMMKGLITELVFLGGKKAA